MPDISYNIRCRIRKQSSSTGSMIWWILWKKSHTPKRHYGSLIAPSPQRDGMAQGIYGERDDMAIGGTTNTIHNKTDIKEYLSSHIFTENEVRKQLDCENLNDSVIDTIVSLMVEVLNMDNFSTLRINQPGYASKGSESQILKS